MRQRIFQKLLRENSALREELKRTKKQLLYTTLEQTINTQLDGMALQAFLKRECGVEFRAANFLLVLLYNRPQFNGDGERAVGISVDKKENWDLSWENESSRLICKQYDNYTVHWSNDTRAIIENCVSDHLSCTVGKYFFQADRDLCCLVNYGGETTMEAVVEGLLDAIYELENTFGLRLTAATSRERINQLALRESYEECLLTHDYGWNRSVAYLSYDDLRFPVYEESAEAVDKESNQKIHVLERSFMNYAAMQKFYQASGTLDSINSYLLKKQRTSLETMTTLTIQRLKNVLSINGILLEEPDCAEVRITMERIGHIRSFPDLQNKTHDFFAQLDDILKRRQANRSGKVEAIESFIEANYQNPDLGATMICERLRISSTYFSKVMKQELGIGLVEAIHKVRLREAKRLLTETNLSLDQIALDVGFSNRWILIRSFKARENMTPSEYREAVKSGKRQREHTR